MYFGTSYIAVIRLICFLQYKSWAVNMELVILKFSICIFTSTSSQLTLDQYLIF